MASYRRPFERTLDEALDMQDSVEQQRFSAKQVDPRLMCGSLTFSLSEPAITSIDSTRAPFQALQSKRANESTNFSVALEFTAFRKDHRNFLLDQIAEKQHTKRSFEEERRKECLTSLSADSSFVSQIHSITKSHAQYLTQFRDENKLVRNSWFPFLAVLQSI